MPALSPPTHASPVLWQEQCPPLAVDPQALPATADAVIVGGGFAGLAAAHELARRGHHTVVVERDPLGRGASTRNGGMVIPELKAGPASLERSYGPLGRLLHREVHEAFELVEQLTASGGIACDYRRHGMLLVAHRPSAVDRLDGLGRELRDSGEEATLLGRDELAAELASEAFHGGLLVERTGGLHPAAFHRGLAERALAVGAEIHDRTTATAVRSQGTGSEVTTDRGRVRARVVLSCTNATADGLLPGLARRVVPVGSFIVATEVLDPDLAASLIPRGRMLVDTRNFLAYWRLTPDGRMLFGGRRSLAPTTLDAARRYLADELVRVHPSLAGVRIEWAWGGDVAVTVDRMPHVGRIDGVWYATGCNGSGVALNTWLGARLAQALCGDAPLPACARLPHPTVPLWRWRRWTMPVVGAALTLQDRYG